LSTKSRKAERELGIAEGNQKDGINHTINRIYEMRGILFK
jgi:hypothetical protein